jgi:hypothetical protein
LGIARGNELVGDYLAAAAGTRAPVSKRFGQSNEWAGKL